MPAVTFCHVGLTVPDIDRAVEFYTKVFGFYVVVPPTETREDASHIGQIAGDVFGSGWKWFRIAHLSTGDGIGIELFQFADTKPEPNRFEYWRPGPFHFCVQDADLEGLVRRIEEHGGHMRMQQVRTFYPGKKPYRLVYCEDPFGNIVEIYSHSYEMTFAFAG